MKTMSRSMGAENAALVMHLKDGGRQSLPQLLAHFAPVPRTVLGKRLRSLRELGWVDYADSESGERLWYACSHRPRPRQRPQPATDTPVLVPPRRIDVMQGGCYRPAPLPPARAGALEHQRYASHGVRC